MTTVGGPDSLLEGAEASIRASIRRGEHAHAARWMIERYGDEILTFLAAVHGSREDAADVFAQASEDVFRSFDRFRGECSLRTWFYAVAKNASRRHFDDSFRRRRTPISRAADVPAQVRSNTPRFLQTDWKCRLRALRERLAPDDRALLVLRVDRGMAWDEIAHVLDGGATSSAALRKRFERIKDSLRAEAARDGWPLGA